MSAGGFGVYLVTDPALSDRHGIGVLGVVRAAVHGGVRIVQVRDKDASARDLLALTAAVADAVGDRATVVVDDRLDVALAARHAGHRVAGVHLGQSDVPVTAARALLGADAHVGLTANTPEHLAAVAALPRGTVDLLGVGVVHPTATKADHPPALGHDGFGRLARATDVPCVAIGWGDARRRPAAPGSRCRGRGGRVGHLCRSRPGVRRGGVRVRVGPWTRPRGGGAAVGW
ncbi:thiamine phosphate synthase [Curtobacterium sp. SORGH_AS_0776]|uniref:thiamine phosphate synthase n=1 Tax=Curtobacterium sp. SORGH_AS_0776 TaxID=3041798 RepID=UPI0028613B2A|nr:thiamine phosphate synthase [Curtobacterium sp. SORGH_AS_0776]MDR6171228.1 thiamine-phosphate diphosphorylase [Curtobacterium sp. SORGH_AS_0776]